MKGESARFYDLVVVGHLVIDYTISHIEQRVALGGPPAYAMVARSLGLEHVGLVTVIGSDFPDEYFQQLVNAGLNLEGVRRGRITTRFTNRYFEDKERVQQATAVADSIDISDFPSDYWKTKWMNFSPILQEIDPKMIILAKQRGAIVTVDIQGYVRCRNPNQDNRVKPCPWKDFPEVAVNIDVLKADIDEISRLTSLSNIRKASQSAYAAGCKIILITDGQRGSYIYYNDNLHTIPALPPQRTIDPTGCGDIFNISFMIEYQRTNRPLWSAYFAATSASFNIETPGPTDFPTHKQVTARLNRFLKQPKNLHHHEILRKEKEDS
ncbi:MAG: carbohydrate kinase family protein [Promethearchaeota archaeon]